MKKSRKTNLTDPIARILNEIRLGNSFLFVGTFSILIYLYCSYCCSDCTQNNNLEGLEFGIITLVYGGIFRLLNIAFKDYKKVDNSLKQVFRFFVWFSLLMSYLFYLDNTIDALDILPDFSMIISSGAVFFYSFLVFIFSFIVIGIMISDSITKKEYSKNENMKDIRFAYYLITTFLIILGIVFLILGASFFGINNNMAQNGASVLISMGMGCFSIGFAVFSIGIAKESDRKMNANANESFLKIWDKFGDKRIAYLNQIRKENFSNTEYIAWKSETYLDRAFDLMNTSKIKKKNRKKMYNAFRNLLIQFPWKGKVIDNVKINKNVITMTDVKNLLRSYKKIRENHLYDEESNELIYLFHPFVQDIDTKISVDKQIQRFIKEIDVAKNILEQVYGKKRRYPFMRLKQAQSLLNKKRKKKN